MKTTNIPEQAFIKELIEKYHYPPEAVITDARGGFCTI